MVQDLLPDSLDIFDGAVDYALNPNPIPEPTSVVLAALGLLSLGGVRWRRRRR